MTFCSVVIVGFHFAPPVVRSTRLRLVPLTTGNDAHHFVNNVRSNPNFYQISAPAGGRQYSRSFLGLALAGAACHSTPAVRSDDDQIAPIWRCRVQMPSLAPGPYMHRRAGDTKLSLRHRSPTPIYWLPLSAAAAS